MASAWSCVPRPGRRGLANGHPPASTCGDGHVFAGVTSGLRGIDASQVSIVRVLGAFGACETMSASYGVLDVTARLFSLRLRDL